MTDKDPFEKMLTKMGADLRAETNEGVDRFVYSFEKRLRQERPSGVVEIAGLKRSAILRRVAYSMVGAAALFLAIFYAVDSRNDNLGMVAHESGAIVISGEGASKGVLRAGTTLETKSRATALASIDRGRVMVFLHGDTRLEVDSLTNVALQSGTAWFTLRPNSGRFQVELPEGTITVHGTSFAIHSDGGQSRIFLANGSISLTVGGETIRMNPFQTADLRFGQSPSVSTSDRAETPDWVSRLYNGFQLAYNQAYFPSLLPAENNGNEEARPQR
jgi:hypothetical protein